MLTTTGGTASLKTKRPINLQQASDLQLGSTERTTLSLR
jgi:hypothetical protein